MTERLPTVDAALLRHLGATERELRGDTGARILVGPTAVLKQHRSRGSYQREQGVYRALAREQGTLLPRLLATDEAAGALLLERVPGRALPPGSLTDGWLRTAARELVRLHRLPAPPDLLSAREAVARRWEAAWIGCAQALSPGQRRALTLLSEELLELASQGDRASERDDASGEALGWLFGRGWCHRDVHPRNWVADEVAGSMRFIDWEHAQGDLRAVDLVRLQVDGTLGGRQISAFTKEYAMLCACDDHSIERVLRGMLALEGLRTLAWGRRHDDERRCEEGFGVVVRLTSH